MAVSLANTSHILFSLVYTCLLLRHKHWSLLDKPLLMLYPSLFVEVCLQLLCTQVPWSFFTELLARVRGSVIRQALASCGAPGSSNITPLSKLNTGPLEALHCCSVQSRAGFMFAEERTQLIWPGLSQDPSAALPCRLFLRATDRTQLCFSDIYSSPKIVLGHLSHT